MRALFCLCFFFFTFDLSGGVEKGRGWGEEGEKEGQGRGQTNGEKGKERGRDPLTRLLLVHFVSFCAFCGKERNEDQKETRKRRRKNYSAGKNARNQEISKKPPPTERDKGLSSDKIESCSLA